MQASRPLQPEGPTSGRALQGRCHHQWQKGRRQVISFRSIFHIKASRGVPLLLL